MNDFKSPTFSEIENHIRLARLQRSAALGEAIGNTLAWLWFGARRVAGTLAGHAQALKARIVARQHLVAPQRLPTPH